MKKSEEFFLPVGFGGNMNYNHVKPGEHKMKLKDGKDLTLIISKVAEEGLSGYLIHPEYITPTMLLFMQCIDYSGILCHRGVYHK